MIVKDRTNQIDGKTFRNPSFEEFYPAIKVLLDGTLRELHGVQIPDTFYEFENKFSEIGKEREILTHEIEGCFELMGLGTSKEDKQVKAWTLNQIYGVNSLEMLAKRSNERIKEGMVFLRVFSNQYRDYFNACLDKEESPDKDFIKKLMKSVLPEPVK